MKSKQEILQRLEEARIEKESCDEAVREAEVKETLIENLQWELDQQ